MWAHDHRFFFTAENVYKGNLMMVNYYSGPDRGNEELTDGVNLKLPSGKLLDWGNIDFDVNLIVSDAATDQTGQLFFDIFDTDGFLGDLPLRQLRLCAVLRGAAAASIASASSTRACRASSSWRISWNWQRRCRSSSSPTTATWSSTRSTLTQLDEQGIAERYDIVVDFSQFRIGDKLYLVNLLKQTDGRKPDKVAEPCARRCGATRRSGGRADHGVPHRQLAQERR